MKSRLSTFCGLTVGALSVIALAGCEPATPPPPPAPSAGYSGPIHLPPRPPGSPPLPKCEPGMMGDCTK